MGWLLEILLLYSRRWCYSSNLCFLLLELVLLAADRGGVGLVPGVLGGDHSPVGGSPTGHSQRSMMDLLLKSLTNERKTCSLSALWCSCLPFSFLLFLPSYSCPSSEIQVLLEKNGSLQLQLEQLAQLGGHSPLLLFASFARVITSAATESSTPFSVTLRSGNDLVSSFISPVWKHLSIVLWWSAGLPYTNSIYPFGICPVLYALSILFPNCSELRVGKLTNSLGSKLSPTSCLPTFGTLGCLRVMYRGN